VPVGGQSVGVGVPKGGIGHTGHIVSAPFARETPSPSGGHRSRKSGVGACWGWPVCGQSGSPFGQSVGVGRPPVRRRPYRPVWGVGV